MIVGEMATRSQEEYDQQTTNQATSVGVRECGKELNEVQEGELENDFSVKGITADTFRAIVEEGERTLDQIGEIGRRTLVGYESL